MHMILNSFAEQGKSLPTQMHWALCHVLHWTHLCHFPLSVFPRWLTLNASSGISGRKTHKTWSRTVSSLFVGRKKWMVTEIGSRFSSILNETKWFLYSQTVSTLGKSSNHSSQGTKTSVRGTTNSSLSYGTHESFGTIICLVAKHRQRHRRFCSTAGGFKTSVVQNPCGQHFFVVVNFRSGLK